MLANILKKFQIHKVFIGNVATLFTGAVVARLVGFATMPVVAWIFSPEDYGVAALFVAAVILLSTASTLSFDQAILLAKNDLEANHVEGVSLRILFFSFFLTLIFCTIIIVNEDITFLDQLSGWVFVIPLGLLFIGLNNIAKNKSIRKNGYKRIATSEVGLAIVTPTSRIMFGLTGWSTSGGLILGYLLGLFTQFIWLRNNLTLKYVFVESSLARSVFSKYRDFALYTTPVAFIKNALDYLPIFILGIMFSPLVVGLYAFANRLIRIPVSLINQSVKQAYIQKTSELLSLNKTTKSALIKTTLTLVLIGIPLFISIYLFSESVFSFVFGETWSDAGVYAQIMSPWLFTEFVITPSIAAYILLKKQSRLLFIQIFAIILRSSAFLYSDINNFDVLDTLVLLSTAGIIENTIILIVAIYITGSQESTAY